MIKYICDACGSEIVRPKLLNGYNNANLKMLTFHNGHDYIEDALLLCDDCRNAVVNLLESRKNHAN